MNRYEAIQEFFETLGIAVYPDSSVPAQAPYPRLTYSQVDGDFLSGEIAMSVDVWFYTESEATVNAFTSKMADAIGFGGKLVGFDDGLIWLKKGSPWCQNVPDDSGDDKVKHRYLNVTLEYITMN